MTIVINLLKSTLNFVVLNTMIAASSPIDPDKYFAYALAFTMGLVLRIMVEWHNNTITWKNSIIQAVMSLCLCWFCVKLSQDIFPRLKLEYCIFFCSLFSIFIVGIVIKTFKAGFSGYARILLRKLLAEDPKPHEEE